jgi:very-short-patch-repair endonuclease
MVIFTYFRSAFRFQDFPPINLNMEKLTDGYRPTTQQACVVKTRKARELRTNQTEAEKILWSRILGNRLLGFHFRKQHGIAGFIVDFYCHQAQLVIEIDGSIHDGQKQYDSERDIVLRSLGLRVLRFSNDAIIHSLRSVALTIGSALKSTTAQ